ncbi:MAG: efflux RND transporter periplasmic adaptor subunit [Bryobacter sp.]
MKRVVPILLLLSVAGYFVWTRFQGPDPNVLTLHGNIEFRKIDVSFKTAGRLVELAVDEGDSIKSGQMLARLDTEQLNKAQDRDRAGVDIAQSQIAQLRTAIQYQKEAVAAETLLRQSELKQAQAKLQELKDGTRPQDLEQARQAVVDLKARLLQAQSDFTRAQQLIAKEDISRSQFDQFQMRAESTAAQLRSAEERLALLREGPRQTDFTAAQAMVARAQAALQMAEAQRLDIQRREQEVVARLGDLERARAGLGMTETQISDTQASAPLDGVVMTKSAELGEVLAAGTPVLTLGEIDRPWFRGYVPQDKLGRVKLGMPVSVRTDSYPGKTYEGKITFLASEAEFTPKQIQTEEERVKLVYRIKVEVANPNRELKLNMPVEAEIRLP